MGAEVGRGDRDRSPREKHGNILWGKSAEVNWCRITAVAKSIGVGLHTLKIHWCRTRPWSDTKCSHGGPGSAGKARKYFVGKIGRSQLVSDYSRGKINWCRMTPFEHPLLSYHALVLHQTVPCMLVVHWPRPENTCDTNPRCTIVSDDVLSPLLTRLPHHIPHA